MIAPGDTGGDEDSHLPSRPADGHAGVVSSRLNAAPREWPLHAAPEPIDDAPLWNFYYLQLCEAPRDPTIVWGTDVDATALLAWLRTANAESDVLVTPAHVLIAAIGRALARHPQFNRRILRRRIWSFRRVNILMPIRTPQGIEVTFFGDVDRKSIGEIATAAWRTARGASTDAGAAGQPRYMRWPRTIQRLLLPLHLWLVNRVNLPLMGRNHCSRAAVAMVNYLGHRGMPPLRAYKPSRLPYDSFNLSVTMGAIESQPVVVDGQVVARPIAPIFVRADHRLVDATEIGMFAATLREYLGNPAALDGPASRPSAK